MIREIQVLDETTIDKIAAGEVVERPASVVKELTENALDALATAITVEIRDGGTTFIRITDNGAGIPAGQVRTAFLRHATGRWRISTTSPPWDSAVRRFRALPPCPEWNASPKHRTR